MPLSHSLKVHICVTDFVSFIMTYSHIHITVWTFYRLLMFPFSVK